MTDAVVAAERGSNSQERIKFVNQRLGETGIGAHRRRFDFRFCPHEWACVKETQMHGG